METPPVSPFPPDADPPENSRQGRSSSEAARAVFSKFRRILDLNTRVLGMMAEMERALGGEYIFDQAFLEKSTHTVLSLAHQVIYSLNAMAGNRYLSLLDRFEAIKSALHDILAGHPGRHMASRVLSLEMVNWETLPIAGLRAVCLAELHRQFLNSGIAPVDGFVVTAKGCKEILDQDGAVSNKLADALSREIEALFDRQQHESLLRLALVPAGMPDPDKYDWNAVWQRDVPAEKLIQTLPSCLTFSVPPEQKNSMAILVLAQDIPSPQTKERLLVRVRTLSGTPSLEALEIHIGSASQPDELDETTSEFHLLHRTPPYAPIRSRIAAKVPALLKDLNGGCQSTSGGFRRGSALGARRQIETLAAQSLALERTLGLPLEILFALELDCGISAQDIWPLRNPQQKDFSDDSMRALEQEKATAKALLRGGQTAQFGVAAGRVVHVSDDTDPWTFPRGGVAVSRHAGPQLSPLLRYAAALITEVGGPAGHLATIAREYRVPAIVGASGALECLPEGQDVTVDAEDLVVYRGILENLLRFRGSGVELYPTDPEYIRLRQLLRWISPLNLLDRDSADFKPENCRTLHDLIHFSHERAVEELLHLNTHRDRRELGMAEARRLELDVPLDLRVLDVDEGVVPGAGAVLRLEDIRCEPLLAFLKGLDIREMWNREPVSLSLRQMISAMDKSLGVLSGNSPYAGMNLAIVSSRYLNLSLRLGYHFSVVDAFLSENEDKNYIYFRFVGGLAEEKLRRRRANMIRAVLEGLEFRVSLKSDLVVGKLKAGDSDFMKSVLLRLGELTGFTRQLDVNMASEKDVERFAELFMEHIRHPGQVEENQP